MKIQLLAATCLLCLASVSAHASCYANGKNYQKGTRVDGDYGSRIECDKGGWKNTLSSNLTNKGNSSGSASSYSKHNSSKSYNKPTPSNNVRKYGNGLIEY